MYTVIALLLPYVLTDMLAITEVFFNAFFQAGADLMASLWIVQPERFKETVLPCHRQSFKVFDSLQPQGQ